LIADGFQSPLKFYPDRIKKEDKNFFIPIMDYFSPEEKEAIGISFCESQVMK
jgi:hypothetical protein